MFPQLAQLTDLSLLLLRLMAAAVFVTSGWCHVKNPTERARSIGMTPAFTRFLGAAEVDGSTNFESLESRVGSRQSRVWSWKLVHAAARNEWRFFRFWSIVAPQTE